MRGNFDRKVSSLSATRSQWQMIAVVAGRPGSTQRVIAETLEMSEASAGRLIDRLVSDGLLERRERDDDRRAKAIYLTQAAEPLLAQLGVIARAGENTMFKGFAAEELDQLNALLQRLQKNLARS